MNLDSKETTRSQFSIPDLRDIHRNLKQEKKFNARESFFRKSPFCTFSCINPGFGGPWDKLWKNFLIAIFIMLQKNVFGKKNFEYHARDQKCHFGKIEKLPKWHFWTWAWNSKKFLTRSILLKHYGNGNKKIFSQLVPGSAKSRIYAEKSTKRGFSKKGLTRIENFFLF